MGNTKTSSNVYDFDYDPRTKELILEFSEGRKYKYFGVSRQRFNAFNRAESLGKYVNEKLSNLRYEKIK
jgi:hypothetical protein